MFYKILKSLIILQYYIIFDILFIYVFCLYQISLLSFVETNT